MFQNRKFKIESPAINIILQRKGLIVVPLFLLHLNVHGQVDPKKVDSLSRSIDSSVRAYKEQQDRVIKQHDSVYKLELNKAHQQKKSNDPGHVLNLKKSPEEKERQQTIVRIVAGVLLFLVAIIALMRKRKSKP